MTAQTANQGSIGASQQGPNDASSLFNMVAFAVRQMMAQLDTMKLVQVTAVNPGGGSPPVAGTVNVQLLVSEVDGNNNVTQQGIVNKIPYFRLQGGPWAIVIDPAVGDFGYVICADRDISSVKNNPGIQPPASLRKYNVSDGIYIGGCLNTVPAATLWLKSDGTWVLTDKPGNVLKGDSNGITATPVGGGAFAVNGNITATGSIIAGKGGADQVGLQTHTHPSNGSPPTPGT